METILEINNYWQLIALIVTLGFGVLGVWIQKNSNESKKLIAKMEELEQERTAHRKTMRDNQIAELTHKIDDAFKASSGVGKSFDRHLDDHKINDNKLQKSIETLDGRLRIIEDNLIDRKEFNTLKDSVHQIDKVCTQIFTILEERAAK